jgi:hypothetical protein
MNPADRGPEKERKVCMSKLIQHEQAIKNLSYKYTLFRPAHLLKIIRIMLYVGGREGAVCVCMMDGTT